MKVIVTGAAGFIGFHLSKRLLNDGFEVIGLDNINNYYDTRLKYGRLSELGLVETNITDNKFIQSQKYEKFQFIKTDLTDVSTINSVFRKEASIVIHLAAQAGVRHSIDNPNAYVQSNLVGFLNILEACRNSDCKKLIYASSSSVYGMNAKIPFSVEDKTDEPVSLYAATKKSNELMAHAYSNLYNLNTTGLRFFTVYGPWGRPDMAYFKFSNCIMKNQPIQIYNEGNMQRDFTYIDDIVEGIYKITQQVATENTPKHVVHNIGNSQPVNLMEFVETLEEELGKKATKELLPHQAGDVYRTWADVSDLKDKYNYQPNTSLKEGIRKFVDWYKIFYNI